MVLAQRIHPDVKGSSDVTLLFSVVLKCTEADLKRMHGYASFSQFLVPYLVRVKLTCLPLKCRRESRELEVNAEEISICDGFLNKGILFDKISTSNVHLFNKFENCANSKLKCNLNRNIC